MTMAGNDEFGIRRTEDIGRKQHKRAKFENFIYSIDDIRKRYHRQWKQFAIDAIDCSLSLSDDGLVIHHDMRREEIQVPQCYSLSDEGTAAGSLPTLDGHSNSRETREDQEQSVLVNRKLLSQKGCKNMDVLRKSLNSPQSTVDDTSEESDVVDDIENYLKEACTGESEVDLVDNRSTIDEFFNTDNKSESPKQS